MTLNPNTKFVEEKFDRTSNFGLWQRMVKNVLAEQGRVTRALDDFDVRYNMSIDLYARCISYGSLEEMLGMRLTLAWMQRYGTRIDEMCVVDVLIKVKHYSYLNHDCGYNGGNSPGSPRKFHDSVRLSI
ncbi:hypothetical protein Lal_00011315 [Lupinus albus]|nr:hypothetical protein Lal_00011315 [Lupinus albus]